MIATTTTQREIIHWILLWILAAAIVSVMQGHLAGQQLDERQLDQTAQTRPSEAGELDPGQPIPMPNIDNPEWFRYPNEPARKSSERVSLSELLQLHRLGDFERALEGWRDLKPQSDSLTWQQVGIGVSLMRLDKMDEALSRMEEAIKLEPTNAVAEYFIARIRQAQGRKIPSWNDEPRDDAPIRLVSAYRLVSTVDPIDTAGIEPDESRSYLRLPQFIDDAYSRLARKHFRRALMLAPKCDLERVIQVVAEETTALQLVRYQIGVPSTVPSGITVGDLLDSWGERDYVRKAQAELGARPSHHLRGAISLSR